MKLLKRKYVVYGSGVIIRSGGVVVTTHSCSFLRGMNWQTYTYLENRLLETSRYIAFAPDNLCTWSENLADLLNITGSAVDTFFRNMRHCPSVCHSKEAVAVLSKRGRKKWNIYDYMDAYEPLYELSKNEVLIPFGLSNLGSRRPYQDFSSKRIPTWWDAYNHVKHEYYDKIVEANLGNVIDALGGLLVLNALHKDSQEYLVKSGVLKCGSLTASTAIGELKKSFIGCPRTMPAMQCLIVTPIFVFKLRRDMET